MKIELKNISKKYNGSKLQTEVFKTLDLTINNGEIISIVGPNGCGKTTLLNIIAKIDTSFNGILITNNNYSISYMFQKDLLIPWRNAIENALLGNEIINNLSDDILDNAKSLFKRFNLVDKIHSFPSTLSGGERQKVALIRTLLPDAELLLLDEPFASLDFQSKMQIYEWLYLYIKQKDKTVLFVSHDIEEAITMGNKVIILNNRPNGVYKVINIEIPDDKRNPVELRNNSLFSDYFSQIWNSLDEISNLK